MFKKSSMAYRILIKSYNFDSKLVFALLWPICFICILFAIGIIYSTANSQLREYSFNYQDLFCH